MSVSVAQRQYVFPSFTMRGMDGLRRKESDGKRAQALCPADATNIEIEITSLASQPFQIVVKTPQGEKGELHFSEMSSSQNFTPETHTCGHGVWSVEVYKLLDSGRTLVSRTENELNGVGTLFYTVDENLEINLHGTNFLLCKGACPLTH